MKTLTKLAAQILATFLLFSSASVLAEDEHSARALEHASVAASHAETGNFNVILGHSKEALHHAKMASQGYHEKHMHMERAIDKLNKAIEQASKKKHAVASKTANQAVDHIHKVFD